MNRVDLNAGNGLVGGDKVGDSGQGEIDEVGRCGWRVPLLGNQYSTAFNPFTAKKKSKAVL